MQRCMSGPSSVMKVGLTIEGGSASMERWLNIGKIVNTHGVRGEVRVWPQTDFPEIRFKPGNSLWMVPPQAGEPVSVTVQSAREQKNVYILKLAGIDDRNGAEARKGWELKVPAEDRVPLQEGEYYVSDIIGCAVVTDEGETIGTVSDVLTPGANDVWVVRRPKGQDLLLPVIDDVVLEVDTAAKRIKVHLMEGLL